MDYYRDSPTLGNNENIIDSKKGDIDGDGITDDVYLLGTATGGLAVDNVRLFISHGRPVQDSYINLKVNKGYGPSITLDDFTGEKIDEVLVSMSTGNTGLEGIYYVYGVRNGILSKMFDYEEFNAHYKYDVIYENGYKVKVSSKFNNRVFTINLEHKGGSYLSSLYNHDGILKKPMMGMVSDITELNPISRGGGRGYDLYAVQRIIGYYNGDVLGEIVTPLRWDGTKFNIINNGQFLN